MKEARVGKEARAVKEACAMSGARSRPSPWGRRVWTASVSVLLVGITGANAADVSAQTVQGRVLDGATARPVSGAVVRLLDAAGDTVAVTVSDSVGAYRLQASAPGRFRLRTVQLGYQPAESAPFDLRADTTVVSLDVRMEAAPVPIQGVEVTTDQANRRLRQFFGFSPGQLRVRPIRAPTLADHASRGDDLSDVVRWASVPNLQVQVTREGPCYRFRGRGCLPVYLDGTRMNPRGVPEIPLQMLGTVVVLLPSEAIAYPNGAVHLFSSGFMR